MAAVGARDAYYWDRPLPGVELREAQLETPVRVVVGGKTYDVKPAEALRVDAAATQQALWNAGRTSFVGRMRTIVDPSPPTRVVDQVLVARPELDEVAARVLRRAAEAAPGAGGRPRTASRSSPPARATASTRASWERRSRRHRCTGARTLSPALTHVEPELTTSAAQAAVDEATSLIDEPVTLEFKGEDVGTLAPARLAKLLRFRPAGESFRISFHPQRVAKAVEPMLAPWRTRAVNARFVVDGKQVRVQPSRPGLAVDGRWAADCDRRRRGRARAPGVPAPEADPRRPDHPRGGEARHPPADLHVHDRHGHVVVEPDPQRAADGAVHRRHRDQARRHVLVQRPRRPAHGRARLPRGSDDHRLAAPARDRRRRLPDRDDALQQRVRARAPDRRAPQPQLLHLALPDGPRRHGLLGRPRLRLQERPEDRDPDQDALHRLDAHVLVLRHRSADDESSTSTGERTNWRSPKTTYALDPYAPRGSVRTVSGSNQSGFDVTVTRKVYEHGKLLRQDATTSNYIAVGPTQIYGPGRSIPGPYFVLPARLAATARRPSRPAPATAPCSARRSSRPRSAPPRPGRR